MKSCGCCRFINTQTRKICTNCHAGLTDEKPMFIRTTDNDLRYIYVSEHQSYANLMHHIKYVYSNRNFKKIHILRNDGWFLTKDTYNTYISSILTNYVMNIVCF